MATELAVGYVSLLPSAKGFQQAMTKELDGVGNQITKAGSKSGKIGKAFGSIGKIAAGSLLGLGGAQAIGSLLSGAISEATDAAKVGKQTAAVLKSTGGAAKVSASQIGDLATALSKKSAVDDEVIQSGENVLLTFTKVANQAGKGNDIFNQATSISLDMSKALGTDLQGSVIQVGKALNDPIKGITALQRVGVTFTQQQKDQIKTLTESGDTLGAQKLILAELNKEFGGSAAASATASDRMSVAWGNIEEQLGTALIPILESVSTWFADVLPKAIDWTTKAVASIQDFWHKYADDVGRVLRDIYTVTANIFKGIVEVITVAVNIVRGIIEGVTAAIRFVWQHWGDAIVSTVKTAWNFVSGIIQSVMTVIRGIIKTVTALIHGDWSGAWEGIRQIIDGVWKGIRTIVSTALNTVRTLVLVGVANVKLAWQPIAALFSFFKTHVYDPIGTAVGNLMNGVVRAFKLGVSAVMAVWNGLKAAVAAPINVVIGFYNKGIAGLWNFVASHVGLPQLPTIGTLKFASGGAVPGTGSRDTVPALLTPGEFIVTKDAAKAWGPGVLKMLNEGPRGTVDPGVFGYAQGGYVHTLEEAQQFARAQAGKPYVFPLVGPNAFDCSGFTSALINYVLGKYPWSRRHSSGTVGSDPALAAGIGDPANGLSIGAKPPYTTNRSGARVGHVAATIGGLNAEATPPAVRVGSSARGAGNSLFTQAFHLPGFGGLTESDKGLVSALRALAGLAVPGLGSTKFADLVRQMFVGLPGKIFDFLLTKVSKVVKDAVIEAGTASAGSANPIGAAVGLFRAVTPFASGGRVRRDGPILAGEDGPEILWGSRGEFVENTQSVASRGAPLIGTLVNNRRDLTPSDLAQMIQISRLQMA